MSGRQILASGSVRLPDGTVIQRIHLSSLWAILNWLQIHKPSALEALAKKVQDLKANFTAEVASELRLASLIDAEQNLTEDTKCLLPHLIVWERGEVCLANPTELFRKFET